MLSVSKVSSSQSAHYYTAGTEERPIYSAWHGAGAALMGLQGPVNATDFERLLNGYTLDNEPLFQRLKINRVSGYDFTFSAPKSVSIASIWLNQKALMEAHRKAVTETLNEIEAQAQTRLRPSRSQYKIISTKNLTVGMFEHATSRADDPQLHTHCVVINTTSYKKKWRAYYARTVFTKIREWGKVYRDKLAGFVRQVGFKINQLKNGFWEIEGVPPKLIDLFSKRRRQIIEKVGEDAGAKAKKFAVLTTRQSKSFTPLKDLRTQWAGQVKSTKVQNLEK